MCLSGVSVAQGGGGCHRVRQPQHETCAWTCLSYVAQGGGGWHRVRQMRDVCLDVSLLCLSGIGGWVADFSDTKARHLCLDVSFRCLSGTAGLVCGRSEASTGRVSGCVFAVFKWHRGLVGGRLQATTRGMCLDLSRYISTLHRGLMGGRSEAQDQRPGGGGGGAAVTCSFLRSDWMVPLHSRVCMFP
jgi:hypothetical protein